MLEENERVGLVHGHVDLIGPDDEPLPEETERHHAMFSAAHRNGVTYAGYAFDCRCFSSALTLRVDAAREVGSTTRRCSTTTTSTSAWRSTARSSSSRARRWRSTATTPAR